MNLKPVYTRGDINKWLIFSKASQQGIAKEFAYRLAAYAEHVGHRILVSSGYRDVAYQKALYDANCKNYPPNGNGYVAKPGSSWHNGHSAVDFSNEGFWQSHMMTGDMHRSVKDQELAKFGLCLPLNYKDARSVFEWWHVQPIETLGYRGDRTKFLDADDLIYGEEDGVLNIKEFQEAMGLESDGIVGPNTVAKAQECLECIGEIMQSKSFKGINVTANGKQLNSKSFIIAGSTYSPVKSLAELMGHKVEWDGTTKTVNIK